MCIPASIISSISASTAETCTGYLALPLYIAPGRPYKSRMLSARSKVQGVPRYVPLAGLPACSPKYPQLIFTIVGRPLDLALCHNLIESNASAAGMPVPSGPCNVSSPASF